jgi:hypothetical protein
MLTQTLLQHPQISIEFKPHPCPTSDCMHQQLFSAEGVRIQEDCSGQWQVNQV